MADPDPRPPLSPLIPFGVMLTFGAIGGLLYFAFGFDTSVAVQTSYDRVQNWGLLSYQQNGIIVSTGGVLVGVMMMLCGRLEMRR